VKGPDLSSGTPDWTCLIRFGFLDLEHYLGSIAIYNMVDRP
jgi:hypothetical protein